MYDDSEEVYTHLENKIKASKWARKVLDGGYGEVRYLDTEATGLGYGYQPIQIGVLSKYGSPMLDTLVKPTIEIEPGATNVHGLTMFDLEHAPSFRDVYPRLREVLEGKFVVIYNSNYDTNVLFNAVRAHDLPRFKCKVSCAMKKYAMFYGDYSHYWGNYKWQKLPGASHSAVEDACATYQLLKMMAAWTPEEDIERNEKNIVFPSPQLAVKWERWLKLSISRESSKNYYSYKRRPKDFYVSIPKFYLLRNQ